MSDAIGPDKLRALISVKKDTKEVYENYLLGEAYRSWVAAGNSPASFVPPTITTAQVNAVKTQFRQERKRAALGTAQDQIDQLSKANNLAKWQGDYTTIENQF